ncbi:hypothetical protein PGB90_002755 [Kerria lacca]
MDVTKRIFLISAVQYQKKWKSLRDCYMRERRSQKSIKSGSAAKHHKVYVYYENLKFLEAAIRDIETTDSLPVEQQPTISDEEDVDGDLQEKTEEISSKTVKRTHSNSINNSKKRSSKDREEEELFQILKHKYLKHDSQLEPDGDKLFLLSLYDEMKSLPSQVKIRVKSQILEIISSAHQSLQVPINHQWNYAAGSYQFTENYSSHHGQHFPPPLTPNHR